MGVHGASQTRQPLPSELNPDVHGPGLEVCNDRLTLTMGGGGHSNCVGSIQANLPFPSNIQVYYYEITVLSQGESSRITIGFADKQFKLSKQPGSEAGSFGYHGEDGRKINSLNGGKGEEYGPPFGTGDTVGAGVHLGRQELFFTKNGTQLRTAYRGVKGGLYPTISLHSKGESVEVNFGQKPFQFDLEGLLRDDREQQQLAIQRVPMSSALVHQLVRKYLMLYGCADTLEAFDEAAGLSALDGPSSSGTGCSSSSSSRPPLEASPEAAELQLRKAVRQLLLAGDVPSARQLLQRHVPQVLAPGGPFEEVAFHLACQQYIEMIRCGDINEAVVYAQEVLSALHHEAAPWEASLRDVVALIAYEQPALSPLKSLLSTAQREMVADVVNSAILRAATPDATATAHPVSALERLLQQLVVVQDMLHEENAGQGEPFLLAQHLLPLAQLP